MRKQPSRQQQNANGRRATMGIQMMLRLPKGRVAEAGVAEEEVEEERVEEAQAKASKQARLHPTPRHRRRMQMGRFVPHLQLLRMPRQELSIKLTAGDSIDSDMEPEPASKKPARKPKAKTKGKAKATHANPAPKAKAKAKAKGKAQSKPPGTRTEDGIRCFPCLFFRLAMSFCSGGHLHY